MLRVILDGKSKYMIRETREVWPLLTVETEANRDS
jgi:hypothetical protein